MAGFPNSVLTIGEEGHSQVEVCDFCGDRGFSNALIYCSECSQTLVHQYCLGIPPGSIDDSFNWLCEYCCTNLESEPCPSTKSGGASTKAWEKTKKRKRERVPSVQHSESPLTLGSKSKRIRKERTENQSFSSTSKVAIGKSNSSEGDLNIDSLSDHKLDCSSSCTVYCHDSADAAPLAHGESAIVPVEDQPEPLLTVLPIGCQESSEQVEKIKCGSHNLLEYWEEPEGVVSSLMENPEEIMRGIVLLVSPSGEIFIHEKLALCDEVVDPYKPSLESPYPTFDMRVDKNGQTGQKCSICETDVLDVPCLRTNEDIGDFYDDNTLKSAE